MAASAERNPPPFPAAEEGEAVLGNMADGDSDEGEDIFVSKINPVSRGVSQPNHVPEEPPDLFGDTSDAAAKSNGVHSDDDSDLFADAHTDVSTETHGSSDRKEPSSARPGVSGLQPTSLEQLEEEEGKDSFDVDVAVTNPEKVGDGMNAYMAFKVSTRTSLPMFRSKAFSVRRRFSDFLGLYEKMSVKQSLQGCIIPPPPEKSVVGMTKVKVGMDDPSSVEFVERRRAALERYLQRVVSHPLLIQDPDVREFLEREDLPRAVNTQTLSGAGFLKMINKASDAVNKMTIKMNESDTWFEDKFQEVENEEQQLRKLHAMVDSLVNHRKELCGNTAVFSKSMAMLGNSEDNTALSRALSQLAEVEDKMEQLHQEQAASDYFIFAELLADYIRLLASVRVGTNTEDCRNRRFLTPSRSLAACSGPWRDHVVFTTTATQGCFDQRIRAWQRWQEAQSTLQKKREAEAKLLWANKPDKLQQAKEEIAEWEARVTQYERDFDRTAMTVRKEVLRFEKQKAKDFKSQIIKYLEAMLQSQQRLIKFWEAFLPEAKAIA
ncbi:sorting nexin-1-like isoform X1 [Betta splendens]|uniref:Sorting nexin-1-like isoform X1 n=1 Tax=Betta splendens TaxID=158456 RepID=A0A9W2XP99_BETSP|nr:sorting nexin-1-like isoform X1 [Betta splendens]